MTRDLVSIFQKHAKQQSNRVLMRYLDVRNQVVDQVTFQELDQQAKLLAKTLLQHANFQDRAILIFKPGLDFVRSFMACLYAGIIAVPLATPKPNRSLSKFQHILNNCEPRLLLSNIPNIFDRIEYVEVNKIKFIDVSEFDFLQSELDFQPNISLNQIAFIQYTSGSTQMPKGVVINHSNLISNSKIIHTAFEHSTKNQGVSWLPAFHDMGLIGGIIQPIYGGYPCDLMSPLNFVKRPINWLKAISSVKATSCGCHNNGYQHCVDRIKDSDLQDADIDLSSWDIAFCGAEPISYHTMRAFCDKFSAVGFNPNGFYPCYGLAESTLFVTGKRKAEPPGVFFIDKSSLKGGNVKVTSNDLNSMPVISCGVPFGDTQVSIVEPETQLKIQEECKVGEIVVKGNSVSKKYWNNPLTSEDTFSRHLKTGDLGFVLEGELYPVGRIKEMIIIDGQNYYPYDIENSIRSNTSKNIDIDEVVVFSVSDENQDEKLIVIIECRAMKKLLDDQKEKLKQFVLNVVATNYEVRVSWVLIGSRGSIPKTSSGKKQRNLCKERFLKDYCKDLGMEVLHPDRYGD